MSEDRTTYLGSHSASGLLGVSPWSGRHDVYMEALGIQSKPPKKEEFQFWFGKRMEPVIKDCYERMTGKKLVAEQAFFRSSEYPFMACHVDGLVLRDDVPYSTSPCRSTQHDYHRIARLGSGRQHRNVLQDLPDPVRRSGCGVHHRSSEEGVGRDSGTPQADRLRRSSRQAHRL